MSFSSYRQARFNDFYRTNLDTAVAGSAFFIVDDRQIIDNVYGVEFTGSFTGFTGDAPYRAEVLSVPPGVVRTAGQVYFGSRREQDE